MSAKITSKEILAKLMATENIIVEHANIPTAGFDVKNRRLLLPNWKDISHDVYTLLISHEVGHALYTPADEWEDAVIKTKDFDLKQVVNIVEDVRIEKMIQQKYPGTLKSFRCGYDELEKSNLFGTRNKKIESYGLLDRLNLHFKLGHFGYANIPFSDQEKPWLDRISACKTFADVLKVASELKKYVEEHPESQGDGESEQEGDVMFTESESDSDSDGQSDSNDQQNQRNKMRANSQDGSSDSDSDNDEDNMSDSSDSDSKNQSGKKYNQQKNSKIKCKTQQHFDSKLQDLRDKQISSIKYANLPKIQLDNVIVPYKEVHSQISNYYQRYYPSVYNDAIVQVEIFKNSSKNVVNQLANIFEMKKKAKLDIKALISKTGKLDTNKVHSYRYNDDIFKKITSIPKGKSHGLVMFIDMSSSMSDNIAGTYEQLLNLVLFCKRINIPFDVYGFTDNYYSRGDLKKHNFDYNELMFEDNFCLRHYFSNRMTGTEFNKALQNIVCIMKTYSGELSGGIPSQESLNMTPLIPAIMCASEIVKVFRKSYNLDIVNTIFLTDGHDTHGLSINEKPAPGQKYPTYAKQFGNGRYGNNNNSEKFFIRDMSTRIQWELKNPTETMLMILKETSGVKTIGFHIIRKSEARNVINNSTSDGHKAEKMIESFKNDKFCEITNMPGYDAYYLIPSGSNLKITDEFDNNIDTTVDWEDEKESRKAMKTATKNFHMNMKQKNISRILLNRFIDQIS
jgi:hypothetical protein